MVIARCLVKPKQDVTWYFILTGKNSALEYVLPKKLAVMHWGCLNHTVSLLGTPKTVLICLLECF